MSENGKHSAPTPMVFVCPNGCTIHGSSSSHRVGHFCRRSVRTAGKHAWLYAYPKEAA